MKNILILVFITGFLLFAACSTPKVSTPDLGKQEAYSAELSYCRGTFEDYSECPEDRCQVVCSSEDLGPGAGCAPACSPKYCQMFSVDECPIDRCSISEATNSCQ